MWFRGSSKWFWTSARVETSKILLEGTTLDYVELEPGEHQFIFMNPNDANYTPPA